MKIGAIEFGEPFIANENSMSVAVPIIKREKPERNYVTIEEIKDKVKVIDTGKINEIKIEGDFDQPVFVRNGTMFEGIETQARAAEKSIVIMPERKAIPIAVRCIHASHPIGAGKSFMVGGSAHPEVQYSLMAHRDQGEVWASVRRASHSMAKSGRSFMDTGIGMMTDNLAENMKKVAELKKEINTLIRKIPTYEYQIGIIILDFKGVVGLEMFDSPESWKAICRDVIKKYADKLLEEAEKPIFKLDEEIMKNSIIEFMKMLEESEESIIFEDGAAKTVSLNNTKVIGEYTKIGNKMIHLIGMRKERRETPKIELNRTENWRPNPWHEPWRPGRPRRYSYWEV